MPVKRALIFYTEQRPFVLMIDPDWILRDVHHEDLEQLGIPTVCNLAIIRLIKFRRRGGKKLDLLPLSTHSELSDKKRTG